MTKLCLLFALQLPCAWATYSIVACDTQTRACGVAVQTNNLAVGASVPYAQAGVGAVASQFETNPAYGPRGLALMAGGMSPDATLAQLLREDGNFDGSGIEARQVGIVSVDGRSANYTGAEAAAALWAGALHGRLYSVQGNGLVGANVLEAMERAFLQSTAPLAERLLAALSAGDAAGGQRTGRESAALLVRTLAGFPIDVDLRVDHSADPIGDLRRLYDMQAARQQVATASVAARKGQLEQAKSLLITAVARAPQWPRLWIRAARVALDIEEPQLALQYLNVAFSQHVVWAQEEIGHGNYAELGADALFHKWVGVEHEQAALAAYEKRGTIPKTEWPGLARKLLEVGHSREAALALAELPANPNDALLRATVHAANGNYAGAIVECERALDASPDNPRARLRLERLKRLPELGP